MKKLLTMIPVEIEVAVSVNFIYTSVNASFGNYLGTLIASLVPLGIPVIV